MAVLENSINITIPSKKSKNLPFFLPSPSSKNKNILFYNAIRRRRERDKSSLVLEQCFWPGCDLLQWCNQIKWSCCWFLLWLLLWRPDLLPRNPNPMLIHCRESVASLCWPRQCLHADTVSRGFQGCLLPAFVPHAATMSCHCATSALAWALQLLVLTKSCPCWWSVVCSTELEPGFSQATGAAQPRCSKFGPGRESKD